MLWNDITQEFSEQVCEMVLIMYCPDLLHTESCTNSPLNAPKYHLSSDIIRLNQLKLPFDNVEITCWQLQYKFTKPHGYMWHARSRLSPLDVMKWCSSRVVGTGLWNGSHHVLPRPLAQRIMHQQPPERTKVPIVIWHNPTKPAQTTLWYCGNHFNTRSLNHTGTCDMQGLGSAP